MHDNFIRLQQAGCCGVGTALRNFQADYARFEFIAAIWRVLPELENSSVEYQAIRPVFKEKEFKAYVQDLIKKNLPEESGDPQVHENVKYIEVPKIEYVEKYITKEVPIYVDKVTEKIIEKEVVKEVPKEIIRNITTPDRIREAHEMLYGIGRPQNVTEALNIYYEEAEVNENVIAFNTIA